MENTAEQIMNVAQEMVQQRGYHGFSYRDIASRIGIRSASIHYYFPRKGDLAEALLGRVQQGFEQALQAIDAESLPPGQRLRRFAVIFQDTFGSGDRLCPFCMMATGQDTVPEAVRVRVGRFWDTAIEWLCEVLDEGHRTGRLRLQASPPVVAFTLLSVLEGGMVIARAHADAGALAAAAEALICQLEVEDEPDN